MTLSALYYYEAQVNFSKTTKLHKHIGKVQFVVFEKFLSGYLHHCTRNHAITIIIIYVKKGIIESQDRQNVDSMHTTCNLHSCYMKKRTHFQPVRNL